MADYQSDFEQTVTTDRTCKCGAVYSISESDGVPGCRSIETFDCKYCCAELARNFGECDGKLIDDSKVCESLKKARQDYDQAVERYVKKHGYNWGTDEYKRILDQWHSMIKEITE